MKTGLDVLKNHVTFQTIFLKGSNGFHMNMFCTKIGARAARLLFRDHDVENDRPLDRKHCLYLCAEHLMAIAAI